MPIAEIALIGESDSIVVQSPTDDAVLDNGIVLDKSPQGIFGTGFKSRTISPAGQIGGRDGGTDVPVGQLVIALNIHDIGAGVAVQVSRVRKLWGSMHRRKKVRFRYTSSLSGARWLRPSLQREIEFSPEQDWEAEGHARALITADLFEPRYESAAHEVTTPAHAGGEATYWLPVWNPTDQDAWPIWAFDPGVATGGEASFSFADFGFGNEQEHDVEWTPGMHDARMIAVNNGEPIDQFWSVMAHPLMDPYIAADLSNADGVMGGVEPLYWIPPYTGTAEDPILLPVTINGPAGAKAKLRLRRFWSAESGLE
ncbi:hypothetical protein QSJ18_18175 [Gordonia sp. ABSL1-1]|uniref:hypothetical protein n=1 Tax=Gordonia sp. ABSL1-1 TaxID=3053923 RepID=UPI0025726147|nr:hypothetical protein [Gordonia sp. ABSL1-1]MDL9938677.1 hypothetical protein [Gordonia sp. ABSL1-1]